VNGRERKHKPCHPNLTATFARRCSVLVTCVAAAEALDRSNLSARELRRVPVSVLFWSPSLHLCVSLAYPVHVIMPFVPAAYYEGSEGGLQTCIVQYLDTRTFGCVCCCITLTNGDRPGKCRVKTVILHHLRIYETFSMTHRNARNARCWGSRSKQPTPIPSSTGAPSVQTTPWYHATLDGQSRRQCAMTCIPGKTLVPKGRLPSPLTDSVHKARAAKPIHC
jgi:hypothetical protein